MGKCAAACRAIVAVVSLLVLIAGIIIYGIFTTRAKTNTKEALDALGVKFSGPTDLIHDQWLATIIVLSILGVLLGAIALFRAGLSCTIYKSGGLRAAPAGAFVFVSFLIGTLMWLATLWLIVVACGYTLWIAVAVGLDKGADKAISDIGGKFNQVDGIFKNVQTFVAIYNTGAALLPASLQAQLAPTLASVESLLEPSANGCPASCLDLTDWSLLQPGLDNTCICDLDRLKRAQPSTSDAWKQLIACFVGLLLMWIGASWLLFCTVANAARALAECSQAQRIQKERMEEYTGRSYLAPGNSQVAEAGTSPYVVPTNQVTGKGQPIAASAPLQLAQGPPGAFMA